MKNLWNKFVAHWQAVEARWLPWFWLGLFVAVVIAIGYFIAWWAAIGFVAIIVAVALWVIAHTEWP